MLRGLEALLDRFSWGEDAHQGGRNAFLIALPAPAVALLIAITLEHPSGQATPYDTLVYPSLAALLLLLTLLLYHRRLSFERVFLVSVAAGALFFVSKLVYILYFLPPDADFFRELSETFPWIPAVYILTSLLPRVRGGRTIAFYCLVALVALSLGYSAHSLLRARNYGEVYALTQLVLANVTFYVLTYLLSNYLSRFVRSQAHVETMERLAYTDLLTGLPNRLAFEKTLEREPAAQGSKDEQVFALLFIDIDGFKLVNDTMGHEAGDALLVQIAERLRGGVRRDDFLARISGDEFVVLLRALKRSDDALLTAEKLKRSLDEAFFVDTQVVNVGASIGVSVYPDDADDLTALLRHADSAMYHVKNSGKNGVKRYHATVDAALEEHKRLERDLRQALLRDELQLFYQPLFDLRSGRLVKAEALLRWRHPERGWISPADFVPLAEASGYIVALGDWVMRSATRQARSWQLAGLAPVRVSVNVSPLQFAQPQFGESVVEALQGSGLGAHFLELELTETIVMRNPEIVRRNLCALQQLGVTVAIDDFGTGYSSLSYLRDFAIDTIKIDRSFVRDLSAPRRAPQYALALVEAIVRLAENLDVEIVAEGIESRAQFELLRDLGCQVGQGYYFARPLSEADFGLLLKQRDLTFELPPRVGGSLN
jgi:diguanylate cyclase